ncbi:LADA_0B10176g1_1 [Lachancea dasiensis]|uniref:LADA_0B10176g1_1 n=1 Tax=Lachancea dasiensis TaxID=1072105 RepID=A0A1G4IVS6_9SACH|nr:LADA_0B10176g1_1 [Lachancea dasiensis]
MSQSSRNILSTHSHPTAQDLNGESTRTNGTELGSSGTSNRNGLSQVLQPQQQQQFVLPSISGLENGRHGEAPSQRLPSMSSSKGFSVASLDNPMPVQHQQPQQLVQNDNSARTSLSAEHSQDPSFKPLNFKDALSYLEQVKFQFSTRPDVYNHFLDIMKDYKSQAIDTLGVIERISTLFKGYPALIQGLNTFLPQGYKIECATDPNDPNAISVITPFDNANRPVGPERPVDIGPTAPKLPASGISQTLSETSTPQRASTVDQPRIESNPQSLPAPSAIFSTANQQPPHLPNSGQPKQQSPNFSNRQIPKSSEPPLHVPVQSQPQAHVQQQQQYLATRNTGDVEFSHAISYVNKIKTRFADQPDIYKHFLEILQTYQREQKPIHEVYAQVTALFQNAPDLLDDFKKFLPDATAAHEQQMQVLQQQQQHQQLLLEQQLLHQTQLANSHRFQQDQHIGHTHLPRQDPLYQQELEQRGKHFQQSLEGGGQFHQQQPAAAQNLPPLGSFSPPINGRESESQSIGPNNQQPAAFPAQAHPQFSGQGTDNHNLPIADAQGHLDGTYPPAPLQGQESQFMEPTSRPEIDLDPSLVPVIPEPIRPLENNMTLIEETSFFDRAKKYLGNKQVYTEFLKILNLFSQDLIGTSELVDKVDHYLGGNVELFDWFKSFVNYVERPKRIENIIHEKHRLDLDLCEACCPSYKKLPKSDTFMPCSGRDEMCWEVLNDEWVGHPVWASEDSGFIAHRKNQYEETLFKIEEERHEYDFYIEANLRTIQTLETIANKIANMTTEEKQSFKLPPGLGHTSLTIYKKVIRKVYDKDRGFEIIDALHENPAISVPIVLKRLKQKDEEWRRAQREWNKVWRELEQKVFYKSLDHLGLTFKQADKKLLTAKQLISEISSIKVDQTNKRVHPFTPKPESQLDYDITDTDVLGDILGLVQNSIDHNNTYSQLDKEKLSDFFKMFLSLFFSIPYNKLEGTLHDSSKESANKGQHLEESHEPRKRLREEERSFATLLRQKHKHTKRKDINGTSDFISDDERPSEKSLPENKDEELIREAAKRPWVLGDILEEANDKGFVENRNIYNMFANSNIYVFLRHLTTLYQRLREVKQINDEVTQEIKSRKVVKFAKDLNLLSTQLSDMGLDFKGTDAYKQLLSLSKRLIENDIEHQWFEESLRQAYKNRAFKIYTIDKVIQSLVKHAYGIVTDVKTSDILILFEEDRKCPTTSRRDQILYRLQVRSHMGLADNMFRIEYNKLTNHVCIQFVAVDDLTLNEPDTLKDRWHYYLTSYALSHPTEGIPHESISIPFLEKNLSDEVELDAENEKPSHVGQSVSQLRIQVNPQNYELQIEPNSKDIFTRADMNKIPKRTCIKNGAMGGKRELMSSFLDGSYGWKKGLRTENVERVLATLQQVKNYGQIREQKVEAQSESVQTPARNVNEEGETAGYKTGDDTDIRADETTTEEI